MHTNVLTAVIRLKWCLGNLSSQDKWRQTISTKLIQASNYKKKATIFYFINKHIEINATLATFDI